MRYSIHVYVTLLIIHDTSNPGSFYWRHFNHDFSMLIVRQALLPGSYHQFLIQSVSHQLQNTLVVRLTVIMCFYLDRIGFVKD